MTPDSLRDLLTALRSSGHAEIAGDFRMRLCHASDSLRVFAAVSGQGRDAAIVVELPRHLVPANVGGLSSRRFAVLASAPSGLPADRGAMVIVLRDGQFEDL